MQPSCLLFMPIGAKVVVVVYAFGGLVSLLRAVMRGTYIQSIKTSFTLNMYQF